jgi:hypothetical protein
MSGDNCGDKPPPYKHVMPKRPREAKMAQIEFDYDLEEIVNMDGVGLVSLKSALKRMPDRIGVLSMLHRDVGKTPSFFNAAQIEALLARYRSDFSEGNPPGHREADEDDF